MTADDGTTIIPVGPVPGSTPADPLGEHVDVPARPELDEHDERPATPANSIIGQINQEVAEVAEVETRDLRVGKIPSLYVRYRALLKEEREDLETAARHRQRLRKKVMRGEQDDGEVALEQAALLLAKACVMLLWQGEDGKIVPLHEALEMPNPLRYNAETVELLGLTDTLALGARPSSVQVVTALHRWGDDHTPLTSTSRILGLWMSGVDATALEVVLEGM